MNSNEEFLQTAQVYSHLGSIEPGIVSCQMIPVRSVGSCSFRGLSCGGGLVLRSILQLEMEVGSWIYQAFLISVASSLTPVTS